MQIIKNIQNNNHKIFKIYNNEYIKLQNRVRELKMNNNYDI